MLYNQNINQNKAIYGRTIREHPHKKNAYVIYIDLNDIDLYYQTHKSEMDDGYDNYMNFIKKNKSLYEDYELICENIINVDRSIKNNIINPSGLSTKNKIRFINSKGVIVNSNNNYNCYGQYGSGPLTAVIVVGSFVVTGVVAYLLWSCLNYEEPCKKKYQLYSTRYPDKIPAVEALLQTILPSKWIDDKIKKGQNVSEAINESGKYLDSLVDTFKMFDETVGSTSTRVFKSISKISLSLGAAIITAGAGGDKIVNIPYFITKAINMTAKMYKKLREIGEKIMNTLKRITTSLNEMGESIEKITKSIDSVNKDAKEFATDFQKNKLMIMFIYDLFNVGFKGGPHHSQCKVEYIMKHYMGSNKDVKNIFMLLCLMNDIYVEINDVVIGFIGSAVDMVVPESLGLAGTLAPMLKNYSYTIYSEIRENMTNNYNRVPIQFRKLIENPLTMKKYLFNQFNKYTLGASDLIIPESVKDHIGTGIDVLANGINKGMGMMYMFLNVFIIFSEINAGVNQSLIDTNINAEKLLKDCTYCGQFILKGTDEDIKSCTRCKKFYMDEDREVTDKELYTKCVKYKGKRDIVTMGVKNIKKNINRK
jgi:hypothetical protein